MPDNKKINKPTEVYFFGTCLIDIVYPQAGMSGIKLLEREGVNVIYPQKQTCCGQPAWNSGYRDEAREVASLQLSLAVKVSAASTASHSTVASIGKSSTNFGAIVSSITIV